MNEKSTPTNPIGVPPSENFNVVMRIIRDLTVSELQSVVIEVAFLIRQKAVEELLAMLRTAQEKEEDAKPTNTD